MAQQDEAVIVIGNDGILAFFGQDAPDLEEKLIKLKTLSTCECEHDHCPAYEMPDWRERLLNGEYNAV